MSMDQIHKEHGIHASAFELPKLPETQQWEPRVTIIWSEGSQVLDKFWSAGKRRRWSSTRPFYQASKQLTELPPTAKCEPSRGFDISEELLSYHR